MLKLMYGSYIENDVVSKSIMRNRRHYDVTSFDIQHVKKVVLLSP